MNLHKQMKTKLILALMATMLFVGNDYQKNVKAAPNLLDRTTRNYVYEEIERTRKYISQAEITEENIDALVSNHENTFDFVAHNVLPSRVITPNQTFTAESGQAIYETVLELLEFYVGESAKDLLGLGNPSETIATQGMRVTGIRIQGVEVDTHLTEDEELLTKDQTRRMFLYGHMEPQKTVIFDEDTSLWHVAKEQHLTEDELHLLNPQLKSAKWGDLLGVELDVTPLNPLITFETETEETFLSTLTYETQYRDDATLVEGFMKQIQAGCDGQLLTRLITTYDGTEIIEEIPQVKPINEVILRGIKPISYLT